MYILVYIFFKFTAQALECYQCPSFENPTGQCYMTGNDYGEKVTCPPYVNACYNNWSSKLIII